MVRLKTTWANISYSSPLSLRALIDKSLSWSLLIGWTPILADWSIYHFSCSTYPYWSYTYSTAMLPNDLFQVSEISFLTSMLIIYLLAMLTELYMYCWFGNEIMYKVVNRDIQNSLNSFYWNGFFQSLNIGDACYLSEWYDCSESAKNELLIIMQRTRKPLKITTLGLSTLSLATFTSVSIVLLKSSSARLLFMTHPRSSSLHSKHLQTIYIYLANLPV